MLGSEQEREKYAKFTRTILTYITSLKYNQEEINMADNNKSNRTITAGRDYIEHIAGDAHTGASIHGDHAQQQVNAQQFADTITPQSSKEDVAKLLTMVLEELKRTDVPDDVKEEVENEVQGAELQVKKDQPDKKKLVDKLKNAVAALKGMAQVGTEAVALGNLIGKAIEWGGDQWITWMI